MTPHGIVGYTDVYKKTIPDDPFSLLGNYPTDLIIPGYVGDNTATNFTIIETGNTNTVAGGNGNNCANSIGFRVYFDRPTIKISFLAVDIDGNNTNPGNAEWVSSMAFNADAFVPYTQTVATTTNLATVNITTSNAWKTLVTNNVSAAAAANIPTTLSIVEVARELNGDAPHHCFYFAVMATFLLIIFCSVASCTIKNARSSLEILPTFISL